MIAAVGAMIAAVVSTMMIVLPEDRSGDRQNPLYWAAILPLLAWAYGLAGFSGWAVRLVGPALFLAPFMTLSATVVAFHARHAIDGVFVAALGFTMCACVLGLRALGRARRTLGKL